MYENEDRKLQSGNESEHGYGEQIEIPDKIDLHIQMGMQRGRRARRRRLAARMSGLTVAMLFVVLVTVIRISPVMAAYIGQVPGLDSLVRLIRADQGIQRAVENNWMQPIGVSETHDGITFTVHHLLADTSRFIVFYELSGTEEADLRHIDIREITLLAPDGTPIEKHGIHREGGFNSPDGFSSYLDFAFPEQISYPEYVTLEVSLHFMRWGEAQDTPDVSARSERDRVGPPILEPVDHVWSFKLPIDQNKVANRTETIPIGQTIEIDGQRITFKQLLIHPTRMELHVDEDPANSKKIFQYDDLLFTDENGTTYPPTQSGVSGTWTEDGTRILYFESSYFSGAQSLTLTGSSAQALDKSKLQVQADLDRMQLLSAPDDRLSLSEVNYFDTGLELKFKFRNDQQLDEHRLYQVLGHQMTDAEGRVFHSSSNSVSSPIDGFNEVYLWFPDGHEAISPVTLTIQNYSTRISEPFRVKVK